MANAPPLPSEFHRVTLVLDGASLKGSHRKRAQKYYRYLLALGDLLKAHKGIKMTKEIPQKHIVWTRNDILNRARSLFPLLLRIWRSP